MLNLEWTPIPTFVLTIGSCTCGIGGFYTNTLVDEETWDYLTCSSKERTASNALALHLNYLSHNYPILCVCCKCVLSLIISGTHKLYSNTFVYWLVHYSIIQPACLTLTLMAGESSPDKYKHFAFCGLSDIVHFNCK